MSGRAVAALLTVLALVAAACGGDDSAATTTTSEVTTTLQATTTTVAPATTTAPSTTTTLGYPYDFAIHPGAPVIEPGDGWDRNFTAVPWVVRREGTWHLFYSGARGRGPKLGLATSEDGVNFTKVTTEEPLFDAPRRGLGWFFIFETNQGWEMLWTGGFTPPYRNISRATAPELTGPWEDRGEVLTAPDREWDKFIVPTGVTRIGDRYYMPYGGWGQMVRVPAIGILVSDDGVTWEPMTEEPIYTATEGTWDEKGVVPMNIVETERGLELLYLGFSEPPKVGYQAEEIPFGRLLSTDGGQTWEPDNDGNPIGSTGEKGWPGVAVVYEDGLYSLFLGDDLGSAGISLVTGSIP